MSEPKIGKWEEGWCPYCGNAAQELADLKEHHAELEEEYDRLDSARGELWFELKNLKQLVGKYDEWQRCDWTGRSNKSLTERQELWQKIMQAIEGKCPYCGTKECKGNQCQLGMTPKGSE